MAGSDPYDLPVGRNDLLGYGLLNAQTLVTGVGAAKISITTETLVVDNAEIINLGQTVIDGTYDVRLRIRNQGTMPLSIDRIAVSGAEFTLYEAPKSTLLQLGQSTIFTVRLKPTTAGSKSATVVVESNDLALPSMQFTIVSTTVASNISGYMFEDFNGDTVLTDGEIGVPNQTVYLDSNANGVQDYSSFTNSTPLTIVDNQTVTSTLPVSGITAPVRDLNVTINATHTWVSDLVIELVSPTGTRVRLIEGRGTDGDNLTNTKFDDQASTDIADGLPPFTGSFRPETPLSAFNGGNANGNWRLEVTDTVTFDAGVVNNWTLDISTEYVASTDENGFYFFRNIGNASYNAISVTPAGYFASGPSQYPVTITNPSNSFRGRDFGVVRSNYVYAYAFLDYDRNGVRALDEPGLPNQSIKVTGPQVAVYTNNTVTAIPDDQVSFVDVPIVIPAGAGPVMDVEVTINLSHTWDSDLNISLIAPSGQVVDLSSGNGGTSDNYSGTIFDDDAALSITAGTAPFTGRFRPEQPLSLLDGSPASGTWRLRLLDTVLFDAGVLQNWSLRLVADQQSTVTTGPTGWVPVEVLPGTQTFDLIAQPNWIFTNPPTGSRTVLSTGTPVFDQTFGTRPINLPPTIDDLFDIAINEDAGPQIINISGITAGRGDSEVFQVTVTSNSTSSITTPLLNYSSPNPSGSILFSTVPDQHGQTVITVTVEDGGADNNLLTLGDNLVSLTSLTVTVIEINDQPLINPMIDMVLNEDAPLQTVAFTGVAAGGGEPQSVRVTATSNNTAVIPNPTVTYVSPANGGTLQFTPIPNAWGISTVTVTVTDAGIDNIFGTGDELTVITTFKVTVLPINDDPTLNSLANLTIDEDATTVTVSLAGITAGPLETQPLRVFASSSTPALIPTPTVVYTSANSIGQVLFAPLLDQFGSSTITVFVEDGGLDNDLNTPIDNLMISRSFVVTVLPVQDPPFFDPLADITIDEDSLNQTVTINGIITGGGEIQPMRIIAKSSAPDELVTLTTTYTSPDPTGTVRIDTLPNQFGTFFITVVLEDGGSDANLDTPANNLYYRRTFSVTINPINDPPAINPIADVVINEDAPMQTVALTGISGGVNETEPVVISATNSNPGLISNPILTYSWPNTTGQLTFVPVANKFGTAEITLTLEDAGPDFRLSTTADNAVLLRTFTITVLPVNDSPTLDPLSNIAFDEDSTGHFVDLTGITAGVDELQPLRVSASSSNTTLISTPTIAYLSPNSTGSLLLSPETNQSGTALIVVTVEDGGVDADLSTTSDNTTFSRTLTLTVNAVNDTPSLDSLSNVTVDEDAPQQTTVLGGISAGIAESQPIRITAVSSNPALVSNPVVDYQTPASAGSLLWTPSPNQNGTAVITVTVEDGGLDQNLATAVDNLKLNRLFTIVVRSVNDQPGIDLLPDLTILEDAAATLVNLTGITAGINETQAVRVTVSSSAPSIIPAPSVTYTSPNSTGSLTLEPDANQFGSSVIHVTVEDGGADNSLSTPGDNSQIQRSFTVTILAVNDAPEISPVPDVSTLENTDVTVDLSGISAGNFESQPLRVTAVGSNGGLFDIPELFYTSPDSMGAIRLTPTAEMSGQSILTVTVEDGGADNNLLTLSDNASTVIKFTATVTPVNDIPTIAPIGDVTFDEDTNFSVPITEISSGIGENQVLQVNVFTDNETLLMTTVAYTSPQDSATIEFVSLPDQIGTATAIVSVMDGGLDNDLSTLADNQVVFTTFAVTVEPINDLPELDPIVDVEFDEDGQLVVELSGIGAGGGEAQSVRITAVSLDPSVLEHPAVTYVSPNLAGSLTLVAVPNQVGVSTIELTIEDAGDDGDFSTPGDNAFQTYNFTVTVNPVNDAPTLDPIANVSLDEDEQMGFTITGISAGPFESQQLRLTATSGSPSLIDNPTITYNSPDDSAELSFTPVANATGSAVVTLLVEDGGADNDLDTLNDNASSTRTFTVTVLPVNDPPTIVTPGNVVVDWNSPEQSLDLTGISGGPGETEALRLTVASSDPGIIDLIEIDYVPGESDATLRFTPVSGEFGITTLELVVEDGGLDGDLDTSDDNHQTAVSFDVLVNAVPVAATEKIRTVRETAIDANVLANDSDANGDVAGLSVIIVDAPPSTEGTVEVLPSGLVRYIPAAGFAGISRFTYVASDEFGAQSAETEVLLGVSLSRLQNPFVNLDVNADSNIAASDPLLVINLLNDSTQSRLVAALTGITDDLDVNGDEIITATDALLVINFLNDNSSGGEGEPDLVSARVYAPSLNDYFFASDEELVENAKRLKGRGGRTKAL